MKNILLTDVASRISRVGGEARMVEILFNGLKKNFNTYYLGFPTDYIADEGQDRIMLKKKVPLGAWARKLKLSELRVLRIAYNLVFVRRMGATGLSKAENDRIMKIAPAVIVSNSLADFPLIQNLKKQGMDFKSVYLDHGCISIAKTEGKLSKASIPLTVGAGIKGATMDEIKRKFFNSFDLNIALTKEQLDAMRKYTDKVTYIPNSTDAEIRKDPHSKRAFLHKYGLHHNDFVVLYLGRMFERQKRVSTLIRAFKLLEGKNFRLVLAGGGQSLPDYMKMAEGDSRIMFTGELSEDDVNDAYEAASVFVLPSAWEALSLVLLEASAHGLPAILSSGAYVPDIKIKSIGRIPSFKTGDTKELARLIQKVYSSQKFREAATRSSSKIAKIFTADRMVERYQKAIRSVIQ